MSTNYRVNGRLHLRFTATGAPVATRLQVIEQTPPLRVVRAFPIADQAVLTHLHNVSGGVLGGDQLTLCAEVNAGARAQLTSTGATRVYRHRPGYATATQHTRFQVAAGGLLEYLPDPLIPYAGARYRQVTEIELADDAGLFYWEIITPGREAHNELFAYEDLQLHLNLYGGGRPLALERLHLTPATTTLGSPARLGHYTYLATFYLCRVGVPATTWLALEKELQTLAQCFSEPAKVIWGVSTLAAHGLSVRALSINSRALLTGLPLFWQAAKQALYGQNAVMPRKVY